MPVPNAHQPGEVITAAAINALAALANDTEEVAAAAETPAAAQAKADAAQAGAVAAAAADATTKANAAQTAATTAAAADATTKANAAQSAAVAAAASAAAQAYLAGQAQDTAPADPAVGDVWVDTSTPVGSACRVHKSGNQTISDATITAVTFDTEDFDDAQFHDVVTNPSRLTIPATGRYEITGQIEWVAGSAAGTAYEAMIWLNGISAGSRIAENMNTQGTVTTLNTRIQVATGPIALNAGDYIELGAYQRSGGSLALRLTATWLVIRRVA